MKKGKPSSMIADRIGGLNAIGFTWQINKYSLLWLEWYEELKQFKLQKSHCEVPRNYKENPTLGIWVNKQRNHYRLSKKDKSSSMSVDRIQLLEAIGFTWVRHSEMWARRYEELKQFKLQKGHCEVPRNYKENCSLGRWVMNQREQYKFTKEGKSPSMSVDRIQALEAIGFTWEKQSEMWTWRYEELQQFKLQKGHCEVPDRYSENSSLGIWVSTQRQQYKLMKEGKSSFMSVDRVQALEAIGFTWQLR